MESLPFEAVARIMDFLRLKEKVKMRSVSRDWKSIAEYHLSLVRCVKCHKDLNCRFGCRFPQTEVCVEASRASVFLLIRSLCPNLTQVCLIPESVNAFRAPPGSGDCGAGAWKQVIACNQLDGLSCVSWDGLELEQEFQWHSLKHISCGRISAPALTSIVPHLEGLYYSHTDFKGWDSLPLGMKYLRTGSEGQFTPILRSRAMRTIVDLELSCPVPSSLSFDPCLPHLKKLTLYSQARASDQNQLTVLRAILDSSPCLESVVLELLFDDDHLFHKFLPQFFQSLSRLQVKLFLVTLRKDRCIAESLFRMVVASPGTVEATIRIPDLSDVELLILTQWPKLRQLKLYSSKPAFRGTAFSTLIDMTFSQSLEELIATNLVFDPQEQQMLVRTTDRLNLAVTFEDDWKVPVSRPLTQAFDSEKIFYRMTVSRR